MEHNKELYTITLSISSRQILNLQPILFAFNSPFLRYEYTVGRDTPKYKAVSEIVRNGFDLIFSKGFSEIRKSVMA